MKPEWEQWNLPGIQRVLRSRPQRFCDALLGEGWMFLFSLSPDLPKPRLALFPEKLICRYRDRNVAIDIAKAWVEPEKDRLKVTSQTTMLEITCYFLPRGSLIFSTVPNCNYPPSPRKRGPN